VKYRNMVRSLALLLGISAMAIQAEESKKTELAVFAGGCFWCMEPPFDKLEGVVATISGYIGGSAKTANYNTVSSGGTGHYEAIQIEYDPNMVSYEELLEVYWVNIDPLDDRGQFCDKGTQYLSAVFPKNEEERALAEASIERVIPEGADASVIKTRILDATTFYAAEDYHQDYYTKNPLRYKYYRWNCGRDARLKALWGDDAGGGKH
jgi:peptide-methionine (S)-S-oxide reductase